MHYSQTCQTIRDSRGTIGGTNAIRQSFCLLPRGRLERREQRRNRNGSNFFRGNVVGSVSDDDDGDGDDDYEEEEGEDNQGGRARRKRDGGAGRARSMVLERHSILQRRSGVSKRPAEAAARYALCTPQLVTKCGRALAE